MTREQSPNSWVLSNRSRQLTGSAIRELLSLTQTSDVISFAGGLPSPKTFPLDDFRNSIELILSESPNQVLQYGSTEGYQPLREWIAAEHSTLGHRVDPSRVLITTGSQQALDLLGKVLIDPGSRILIETPTYLGAMQAFAVNEPLYVSLRCDEDGLTTEDLTEQTLHDARLMYMQPDFQNPTGRLLPLSRRRALAELAIKSNFPIIEDSPYRSLSYGAAPLPTVFSMAPEYIVHVGTFSKVLAPGLRVGYVIAPMSLYDKLLQAKQATDLHSPFLSQQIVYDFVSTDRLPSQITRIRELYQQQASEMLSCLKMLMPKGTSWNTPQGGMFIWLRLPSGMDSNALLSIALAHKVAFVPGSSFYGPTSNSDDSRRTLRLSFATSSTEQIREGVSRLADAIEKARKLHR